MSNVVLTGTTPRRRQRPPQVPLLDFVAGIESEEGLRQLLETFPALRGKDQDAVLDAVMTKLDSLALGSEPVLQQIGSLIPSLVLEGTLQQQFFCKLATRFGFGRTTPVEDLVVSLVGGPMIRALHDVIRVGAETTRDSAIEGMGALLKISRRLGHTPEDLYPVDVPVADRRGEEDLNRSYAKRLERRRLMVLAVADPDWREKLLTELARPIEPMIDDARQEAARHDDPPEKFIRKIENIVYRRSDLLRVLPGIARQNDITQDIPRFVAALCAATKPLVPLADDPDAILIAYARHQESVFRTIDNMIRRGVTWANFDDVVADAVHAVPRTMTGMPRVCNAQVRATVSILRTAIRVVSESGNTSKTKLEIRPLFEELGEPRPWLNLGIAEACYRGLPELLRWHVHEDLYEPALEALFTQLRRKHDADDLAAAHRRLVVTSCFRRMLIALADSGANDDDLRLLLSRPVPDDIVAAFHSNGQQISSPAMHGHSDIDADVIAAIGYECELLHIAPAMFQRWRECPSEQKLLLTRVLAALMHAVSRDAAEVQHYEVLRRVFVDMKPVVLSQEDAVGKIWDLLARLPAGAGEAADPDIQRFVEYRGRRTRSGDVEETVEDLPGYVLAMISREASDRIAGAIAREIDLNLRHDRDRNPRADFAEPLYQVILRGPHESIFDHLLPRIVGEQDRKMVRLFRKYVSVVREGLEKPQREAIPYLRSYVDDLLRTLLPLESPLLFHLACALTTFDTITSEKYFWPAIAHHQVGEFFKLLDQLDALASQDTFLLGLLDQPLDDLFKKLDELDNDPKAGKVRRHHALLTHRYATRLLDLQTDVKHYVGLRVSNFSARSAMLEKLARTALSIETELTSQEGLEPPKRVLLVALMAHLHDVFERSKRWYCDEAQRHLDENDKDGFWIVFALAMDKEAQVAQKIGAHFRSSREITRIAYKQDETRKRIDTLSKSVGEAPPRYPNQSQLFEEFAVDWMSSDLDLEALRNALSDRWGKLYNLLFAIVTRPWATALAILLPFLVAAVAHEREAHWFEGFGFWVIAAGIVSAAGWALIRLIVIVVRRKPHTATERKRHGYLFRCQLPQLAGFIAAPMALIAKFDHSYEFPLVASPFAVALLLLLAFQTTRFFLEREVVDRSASSIDMTLRERQKVSKIVGVALAQSFGIAVLLSVIFVDTHHRATHPPSKDGAEAHEHLLRHTYPDFMGKLPHQAFLEWDHIALPGFRWNDWVKEHGQLTYYPTTILSWTALGLFFGLVIEGIGKGEHLRRRIRKETHA